MKISHCFLVSMCISISSYAQHNLDSLKDLLRHDNNINSEQEGQALYQIGSYFNQSNQYDSAIKYFNKMLEHSSSKAYRASALNGIGVSYSSKGFPAQSITYYTQAIHLYEQLHDTTTAITISNNLAIIYKDKGLYEKALEISFDVLPKLEKQKPARPLASCYNTIGTVYTRTQDYAKAYDYYRKALNVRLTIGYEQGVGQSYSNIGELFNEMGKYDSALANLDKAAEVKRKIDDKRGLGRTLTWIAHSLIAIKKSREAITKLDESIQLAKLSNDLVGEILALHELAAAYIIIKDYTAAEKALKSALSMIDISDNKTYSKRNAELMTDLYRSSGERTKLIGALERLILVKDSVLNDEKIESLVALEIQYETDKKEQEITFLQQQQDIAKSELGKRQLRIIALTITIGLLLAVAILGYRLYFISQREKKSAELYNREINHRTKNNLQMLSSFFTIQASLLNDDKRSKDLIIDTEGRVKTMALVHNKLYRQTNVTELDLKDYVDELVRSLLFTYRSAENKLNLEFKAEPLHIDIDKAVRIGLIANELITNSLKYAYKEQKAPLLKVSLIKTDNLIHLEITDNGLYPLSPDTFEMSGSFGLRMVKSFVRELKGEIRLLNINGTSFQIVIP